MARWSSMLQVRSVAVCPWNPSSSKVRRELALSLGRRRMSLPPAALLLAGARDFRKVYRRPCWRRRTQRLGDTQSLPLGPLAQYPKVGAVGVHSVALLARGFSDDPGVRKLA